MLKEFKKFAMRGNVMDMAVGIIIGGAFGTIVKSLVNDVLMPPIGMATGGMDFSQLGWTLQEATVDAAGKVTSEAVVIKYGLFINAVIAFLIVAFAVFLLVKGVNKMTAKEEEKPKPKAPSNEEKLLSEIRDLLKAQNG
ncbi:MAG: large-conductance mechanosensitive channel protein MscL [Planctomycetota bacterium]|nr:large-conductance mechanosensitive channel protein MscL [Planctomycetota bacterium]